MAEPRWSVSLDDRTVAVKLEHDRIRSIPKAYRSLAKRGNSTFCLHII